LNASRMVSFSHETQKRTEKVFTVTEQTKWDARMGSRGVISRAQFAIADINKIENVESIYRVAEKHLDS